MTWAWNHRVIRHKDGGMEIVEVYYPNPDKAGKYYWATAKVYAREDEGVESLREQVKWFEGALEKPILSARGCSGTCCPERKR